MASGKGKCARFASFNLQICCIHFRSNKSCKNIRAQLLANDNVSLAIQIPIKVLISAPHHGLRHADDLCPSKLIINGTAERHALSSRALQIDVSTERPLQMTPLFVLQQRLLEVHVSLGNQHRHHPIVLNVRVAIKVCADCLASLRQFNVEIVQDQHAGKLSEIRIRNKDMLKHARNMNI